MHTKHTFQLCVSLHQRICLCSNLSTACIVCPPVRNCIHLVNTITYRASPISVHQCWTIKNEHANLGIIAHINCHVVPNGTQLPNLYAITYKHISNEQKTKTRSLKSYTSSLSDIGYSSHTTSTKMKSRTNSLSHTSYPSHTN